MVALDLQPRRHVHITRCVAPLIRDRDNLPALALDDIGGNAGVVTPEKILAGVLGVRQRHQLFQTVVELVGDAFLPCVIVNASDDLRQQG